MALVELLAYVAITALGTWLIEQSLIREAIGYLVRRQARATVRPAS